MIEELKFWKPEPDGDLSLDHCPFCGSEEVYYVQYKHAAGLRWKVRCHGCMAEIDPGYAQERHTVRDKWNRRA